MDGAKQLEKTRREIAKKLDKDKEACAAREQELSEAAAALEEAQKRVSAAQNAKRKQSASKLALEVGQWPLLSPHPCPPFSLYRGCVGDRHRGATDTGLGTGGDERGDARAEGEQPTSQGADTGVPSAARQEQRRRLGRGVSSAALVLGGTPRKFMPGAQFLHGSRLSVLGDDTEDEWPQGAHARVLA